MTDRKSIDSAQEPVRAVDAAPPVHQPIKRATGYKWRGVDVEDMTHDQRGDALRQAMMEVVRLRAAAQWGGR